VNDPVCGGPVWKGREGVKRDLWTRGGRFVLRAVPFLSCGFIIRWCGRSACKVAAVARCGAEAGPVMMIFSTILLRTKTVVWINTQLTLRTRPSTAAAAAEH
jgi:hypothetical protein